MYIHVFKKKTENKFCCYYKKQRNNRKIIYLNGKEEPFRYSEKKCQINESSGDDISATSTADIESNYKVENGERENTAN